MATNYKWVRTYSGWGSHHATNLVTRKADFATALDAFQNLDTTGRFNGLYPAGGENQKIFVAAEYCFTNGAHVPLTEIEKNALLVWLTARSQACPDVLMFAGTVLWTKSLIHDISKRKTRIAKIIASYNETLNIPADAVRWDGTALPNAGGTSQKVFGGGVLAPVGKVGVVNKPQNVPNTVMNMLRNTNYVFKNGTQLNKYHKVGDYAEPDELFPGLPNNLIYAPGSPANMQFNSNNYSYVVEVCLDQMGSVACASGGRVDRHILMSDHVAPVYDWVKDDGFFVHASTNNAVTDVKAKGTARIESGAAADGVIKIPGGAGNLDRSRDFVVKNEYLWYS